MTYNADTPLRLGRPPLFDRRMKHVHVRMDEATIAMAKELGTNAAGKENLSEGLRLAVRLAHSLVRK